MDLRNSPVYLDESYYNECNSTIDPDKISLFKRNESDVCIHPFIHGAIDPNKFYSMPKDKRLVVVLKEPFTEKIKDSKEILQINQAEERNKKPFSKPEDVGDKCYKSIIRTAALLFEGFISSELENHFDTFRNNVCIREINRHPAFSNKSDDSLLRKWGKSTRDAIISEILNDTPGIIIFGGTLNLIIDFENRVDGKKEIQNIFGFKNLQRLASENDRTIVYFNNDIIIVDANHPSAPFGGYSHDEIKELVDKAHELRSLYE